MIARPDTQGLRLCFSTLGCAELSLAEICELAGEFGVPGIELRGISGRMDMPECCVEQGLTAAMFLQICTDAHVRPVVAGSSFKLCSASEQDLQKLLLFSHWAESLQIPYVRVFGGGAWGTPLSAADFAHAVKVIEWWHEQRVSKKWSVDLLLETHDAFSGSIPCLELSSRLRRPMPLIWDSHHTWRVGGEAPEETWHQIGPWVRHVHFKDSVDRPSSRHPYTYVLPGDGQMPLAELFELLRHEAFRGYVSLEWERFWHPYLPPLREALNRLQSFECYV